MEEINHEIGLNAILHRESDVRGSADVEKNPVDATVA